MTVANALRAFFNALNGTSPAGKTVAEVIHNGTLGVQRNNESALTTRVVALEAKNSVEYEAVDGKSFVLKSSTTDSVKEFSITVDDTGTLTATELVPSQASE